METGYMIVINIFYKF